MKIVENIIVLIFVILMTWHGTSYSLVISQKTPAMGIPMWFMYCIIPISGLAIIIEGIGQIISLLRAERKVEQV
jgi:TRAP-type C4-dicarboxylate transport system permease small subunit